MVAVAAEYQSKRALRAVFERNMDSVFRFLQSCDAVVENELHIVFYGTEHNIQKCIAFDLPVSVGVRGIRRLPHHALRDIIEFLNSNPSIFKRFASTCSSRPIRFRMSLAFSPMLTGVPPFL